MDILILREECGEDLGCRACGEGRMRCRNLATVLGIVLSVTGRAEFPLFIPQSPAAVGQVTTDLLGTRPIPSKDK